MIETIQHEIVCVQIHPFLYPLSPLSPPPPPYEQFRTHFTLFSVTQLLISKYGCTHVPHIQRFSPLIFYTLLCNWPSCLTILHGHLYKSIDIHIFPFSNLLMQIHADFCDKLRRDHIISGNFFFYYGVFLALPKSRNHVTCANKTAVSLPCLSHVPIHKFTHTHTHLFCHCYNNKNSIIWNTFLYFLTQQYLIETLLFKLQFILLSN